MTHTQQTSYKGIIVEESLENIDILKDAKIIDRVVSGDGKWHMRTVLASPEYLQRLAQSLKPGTWYAHFWNGRDVIAVFKDKIFQFDSDNRSSWEEALSYGRSLGIPEEQLDFPIDPRVP